MATFFGAGGGSGANADDIIAEIVDSAPETLNTLNELAAALNDDANFATTVTTALSQKLEASDIAGKADLVNGFVSASQLKSVREPGPARFVRLNSGVSNTAEYSNDGISWNTSNLPNSLAWSSVAYGNGFFLAISPSRPTARSTDGITWQASSFLWWNAGWQSMAYGNGVFVVLPELNSSSGMLTTNNGLSWQLFQLNGFNAGTSITFSNGKFYALRQTTSAPRVISSINGADWVDSSDPLPTPRANERLISGFSPEFITNEIASKNYVDNQIGTLLARIEALESGA